MSRKQKQVIEKATSQQRYIVRTQAIKKLQLTISDFRKLCILKGIFPREPKHKRKLAGGSSADKTWYALRDIQSLLNEPLLGKLRQKRAFSKKFAHYVGRREPSKVRSMLESGRPDFNLDHLVRERYPTFDEALEDLDDCLSMIALFALLPRTVLDHDGDHAQVPERCAKLIHDFNEWLIATGTLTKAFISVKGFYFRAEINGHKVTWIVPHALAANIPADVDLKIMLTFVDFYCTLLKFVNVRLYKQIGLNYTSSEECDLLNVNRETVNFPRKNNLLAGRVIFLSREVPLDHLVFLVRAMGGTVGWQHTADEGNHNNLSEDDPRIDIQVTDRPVLAKLFSERSYVQPQWIVDSLNQGRLLEDSIVDYAPGSQNLPSHYSPFAEECAVQLPVDPEASHLTMEQRELAKTMLTKRQRTVYDRIQRSRQRTLTEQARIESKRVAQHNK